MPVSIAYPVFVARTCEGEVIAGPSLDCQRMKIAAQSYEMWGGIKTSVVYVETLTAAEAQVFAGKEG